MTFFFRNFETSRGHFSLSPLSVSFFLTLYVFMPSLLLATFLLLRIGGPKEAYWFSCLSILIFLFFMRKQISFGDGIVILLLIAFSHAVSYYFFDMSHDSLAYFGPAVRRIAAGFNPVYDGYMDLGRPPDNWSSNATYFPKSMMYFAASVTAVTGDIQFGKAYQLLLLAAVLLFVWNFAAQETAIKKCLWLAMCLNPVVLTQWQLLTIDGTLASLSLISLAYAAAFFECKPLPPAAHATGVMALTLLFCVKTTGFPFASIIIFFIILNRFISAWRGGHDGDEIKKETAASRLNGALRASFPLALRLGGMVLLLVALMGFHPYITNMRQGKNILYPAIQSGEDEVYNVSYQNGFEIAAKVIYPAANNRFTRLLYSTFSHTLEEVTPSRQKSPFSAPYADWELFGYVTNIRAGAMGPLFSLLLLMALILACFCGKLSKPQIWLLFTVFVMIFIQPHAWQMRYAPFYWCVPFLLLLSIPAKKEYLVLIPLLIALANDGGILFHFTKTHVNLNNYIRHLMTSHAGETVMLDKSIFEYESFFDRYSVKQKFLNPEETQFFRYPGLGALAENPLGSTINLFFKEDLPPLPDFPLIFPEEAVLPWMLMSEGIAPLTVSGDRGLPEEQWRSYDNKIKFFMRVDEKPESDWLLTLKGNPYSIAVSPENTLSVFAFANNQMLGGWIAEAGSEITLRIPRHLLEESFEDETGLFTLMLRMPKAPYKGGADSPLGLELKEINLRPVPVSAIP